MNILIGGAMRSGKTQVAESLAKRLGFSYLSSDSLVLTLRDCFPEIALGGQGKSYDELCDAFLPVLEKLFFYLGKNSSMNYVVDGHFIRPRDIQKFGLSCKAFFLGFPGIDPEMRLSQLRAYGKTAECYTNNMEDADLLERVNRWVEYSKSLRKECLEYEVPFLDVIGQDGRFAGVSVDMALRTLGFTHTTA
ncbi:AAA family ATPase [Azohydromonas caseinilytica]|uniref:Shikimate kinase n=1 Tax=Azohydromonas caseinilytica TaxID=2728836 RepID=A0A848FDF5_9BURK|nr:AAA family ATPase [Azohydromonas caseinilytica]NML17484.1 hypothetical protein [Azohydromonas caseinilytica]